MRVLGVQIQGSDTIIALLHGTATQPIQESSASTKIPLPVAGQDQVDNLLALKAHVQAVLVTNAVDMVAVIRAEKDASPIRAKLECMIQLAAREQNVACLLVSALTVNAAEKRKAFQVLGVSLEDVIGEISPAYLRRAVFCAWSALNGQQ